MRGEQGDMARQVLIIYVWSDTSASFRPLATFLGTHGYQPKLLWLGDTISRDDDVGVENVAKRMSEVIDEAMARRELDASFDMTVHRTGGWPPPEAYALRTSAPVPSAVRKPALRPECSVVEPDYGVFGTCANGSRRYALVRRQTRVATDFP